MPTKINCKMTIGDQEIVGSGSFKMSTASAGEKTTETQTLLGKPIVYMDEIQSDANSITFGNPFENELTEWIDIHRPGDIVDAKLIHSGRDPVNVRMKIIEVNTNKIRFQLMEAP